MVSIPVYFSCKVKLKIIILLLLSPLITDSHLSLFHSHFSISLSLSLSLSLSHLLLHSLGSLSHSTKQSKPLTSCCGHHLLLPPLIHLLIISLKTPIFSLSQAATLIGSVGAWLYRSVVVVVGKSCSSCWLWRWWCCGWVWNNFR